ncbi:GNAT family N-acetyltransferase [Paenibacillus sp. EC2-1]|uniref:GNAT family N-acetyltransferase n=1 Tax=Paenibacillus sp. EC2-1 TaxID=3388665 RepID=UPI003BEF2A6F
MNYWRGTIRMEIIHYNDSYFEELVRFLKNNWAENHPIYDKMLFDWQYRIDHDHDSNCQLLVKDGKIIGFLGNIPGDFSIAGERLKGVGLTMWIIDKAYRDSGLGVRLLMQTERESSVTYTLGCGPQVVPLYKRMGYTYIEALNRYVMPLDRMGYSMLLQENRGDIGIEIAEWVKQTHKEHIGVEMPTYISAGELECLYTRTIQQKFVFSQYRDCSFWDWRYTNSSGYKYHYFGDPKVNGVIVVRIDRTYAPEDKLLHGLAVLRIIEILPANSDVWDGAINNNILELLQGVLQWAKMNGCVAADFQISNNRLEHLLMRVGFRKQNIDYTPYSCGLAGLFQPFRPKVNRINFTWKITDKEIRTEMLPNETYFVKSDCDMDRPNVWPLPEGWNT